VLVLYNPHVDDFLAGPPHFKMLRRRPLKKYGFLLDQARREGESFATFVDSTVSAFIPNKIFARFPSALRRLISELEYRTWLWANAVDASLIRRLDVMSDLSKHVLLAFSYKAATEGFHLRHNTLQKFGAVVFHLSHYFISTDLKSSNLKSLTNAFLAGDSDVRTNCFFLSYFAWYVKPFIVLPFYVADRFKATTPFIDRNTLCLATGTFHDLTKERPSHKYRDFIQSTGLDTYHPVRKRIYLNRERLSDRLRCLIVPYRYYSSGRTFARWVSHFRVSQKKYFSVDIVRAYNDHKFAVVGEEVSGFPALGALEAMACGCVLLAQSEFYFGLPFAPLTHFLPYDGTIEGLEQAMDVRTPVELEAIATAGRDAVLANFSPQRVYRTWQNALLALQPPIDKIDN
jgi:hypothetical protein